MVIGGVAAVLHGSARNTFDLDICFDTEATNVAALGELLVDLHGRLKGVTEDIPFVPDARTLRQVEVLTLVTSLGELDVLAKPSGAPKYEVLRRNAARFDVGGFVVRVAAIEDLIAMKRSADRDKDRADVVELEAILRLRAG